MRPPAPCNACTLVPRLDLKFVAHHGSVVRQRVAGFQELAGSDVVVVHRLLKNTVSEQLGLPAYALFTDACLVATDLDPTVLGLREHRETYEHLGALVTFVMDLERSWQRHTEQSRVVVPEKESLISRVVPLAPAAAWEMLTSPARRPGWQVGVDAVVEGSNGGRRGVGTTNHCIHGEAAVIEEILDWRPYDYVTLRSTLPIPGAPTVMTTIALRPVDAGTEVTFRLAAPRSARARAELAPLADSYAARLSASFDALLAELGSAPADTSADEPELPSSEGRFIASPIEAGPPSSDGAR